MDSTTIIKIIEADGWFQVRVTGSHHHFKHATKLGLVTVPHPKKDLPKGTCNSILKQAVEMNTLIFPIAIEPGDETHAFGVVVPDLPGCFSAGDTLSEAYANVKEAIETHLAVLIDEGMTVPAQRSLSDHRSNPDYADWLWGVVEVADIPAMKKTVRLNISLPEGLLRDIDAHANSMHLTRSGFLAQAALKAMGR